MNPITYCEVCNQLSNNDVRPVNRNGEFFAACKACRFKYGLAPLPLPSRDAFGNAEPG